MGEDVSELQLQLSENEVEKQTEQYYWQLVSLQEKMSDLLEAQLLYQQSQDRRTDAYADYQNKLLEYRQATGQQ